MSSAPSTIFALSSAPGKAGVSVIRISGPAAGLVLDRTTSSRPQPRYAGLRRIRHPDTAELLDEALVLWLPGPRTETGEDMVELHIHGSPAVTRAVLAALAEIPGCRLAQPGEFARRAFENGRIDLTAVEGLADLVDAETDAQRRQALVQAGGALARLYGEWRERIIAARALVEAAIDFSDEEDVARDAVEQARQQARTLHDVLCQHLSGSNRGEIIREGFRVVLAGRPNAGKSSLLNALAQRDVAIVSPEAGTTRDVIEVRLDLGGYVVVLADTAGIRAAQGAVEKEGIRRTLDRARDADLVLWLVDVTEPELSIPAEIAANPTPRLTVRTKIDMMPEARPEQNVSRESIFAISSVTGAGLDALTTRLRTEVENRVSRANGLVPTRERHRQGLEAAKTHLAKFLASETKLPELAAEELRLAGDSLGRVVGRVDVEDVLDQIFSRFCIGK
ncbi:MAG: tRNA uridine-5-carboxymethylaminomethyl(34) synthesis GTPase MnmE [Hyphomicrobiaceae bacterium]